VNCFSHFAYVGHKRNAFFLGKVDQLAHMMLARHDATPFMALLLEEIDFTRGQFTDLYAESIYERTFRAISTIHIHFLFPFFP
jgi:hypothetical protein